MYFAIVFCLTLAAPVGAIVIEHSLLFEIHNDDALPLVRELGIANFAAGTVGILSLLRPDFLLPSAIAAAIFYDLAGFRHAAQPKRNAKENFAMATDLLAFAVLAAHSAYALSP
jgi:hypothetical protein